MKPALSCLAVIIAFSADIAACGEAVYLIRHAEKATGEDPALTETGRLRAAKWADMLSGTGIAAVITTNAARTRETGEIIADTLGAERVEVQMSDTAGVLDLIAFDYPDVPVLVVGHEETLPALLAGLGAEDQQEIQPGDFSRLFVVAPDTGMVAPLRMPGS